MEKRGKSPAEWSRKILDLRRSMSMTQAAFASRLHYSAMALSRWERGTHEPPAQAYIQMGNLAGDPERRWFWARAGLKSSDLSHMFPTGGGGELAKSRFPELEVVVAGSGKRKAQLPAKARLVAIPLLKAHAATHGEKGDTFIDLDDVPASEVIAAPEMWCPNPAETNCLRVRGASMSPIINDDDIVAVDCTEVEPKDLSGKIVVTWHQETGLTLSRFLVVNGVQLLESENRDYEPIKLGKNRNWRIIGKVLWSIRKAP